MAQGAQKQKSKVPQNIKSKQKKQGSAFTRRHNAPQKAKNKISESQKIKHAISKMVNKSAEDEIRGAAHSSLQVKLSEAQVVVAKHHNNKKKRSLIEKTGQEDQKNGETMVE